jgi:hypothetical protein
MLNNNKPNIKKESRAKKQNTVRKISPLVVELGAVKTKGLNIG